MWSGGDDYSEDGERVRIYQAAKKFAGRQDQHRLSESFVGGKAGAIAATATDNDGGTERQGRGLTCPVCQDPLYLLLQLFVPNFPVKDDNENPGSLSAGDGSSSSSNTNTNTTNNNKTVDRTLQVFACNRAACINGLFTKSGALNYGGDGIIVCRRMATDNNNAVTNPATRETSRQTPIEETVGEGNHPSSGGWDDAGAAAATGSHESAGDWNVDGASDDTLLALESQLAKLETTQTTQRGSKTRANPSRGSGHKNYQYSFSCYELRSLLEPPPPLQHDGGDDEDDIDICVGGGNRDDKIQQMLARYMQEEDDEEILAALRGSNNASSNSGGGGGEPDERLPPDDAALFAFKSRLQRAPQQVVRYCLGGVPMWSIPVASARPLQGTKKNGKQKAGVVHNQLNVPKCACGASRRFEFQILPSLLHVLEVDRYAKSSQSDNNGVGPSLDERFASGAMNWGNVACYSCPKACSHADEFLVVQESNDEKPSLRQPCADEPVFVQQDGKNSDPDDDDDDNCVGFGSTDGSSEDGGDCN